MRAVLEARLASSELTLQATKAAVLHGGARGYLEHSGIARRQREGNFVALITPSIRHLRQELARSCRPHFNPRQETEHERKSPDRRRPS